MKKLRKRHSGEGYIDVCVLVVCAMPGAGTWRCESCRYFVAKQQLDTYCGGAGTGSGDSLAESERKPAAVPRR